MLGALACCVVYAGYGHAETFQFHLSGPISSASPGVNTEADMNNTPRKITHVHPSSLMVQGWPVNLPYDDPECGNVIVDALRKNSETYVANKDCRAAMRKAFEIQRTTPPPDPREMQHQAIGEVMQGAPEVPTDQEAPETDKSDAAESPPGERISPFLERVPN